MKRLVASVIFACCGFPAVAETATEAATLRLSEAALQLEAAEGAGDRIAALTSTVRAYEAGLAAMREGLVAVTLRERALVAELEREDAGLAEFLTLLQTVSRHVEAEALVHPGGALPNIQAGMLVSSMVPDLQARATALETRLVEVGELRSLQEAGMATLEEGRVGARAARLALSEALTNRTDLPPRHATDDAAMEALLNSTETLQAFADALVREVEAAPEPGSGAWMQPVTGEILRRFDEADAAGVRRPGLIFATPPEALVVAPAAATVLFAGEVPDQGNVVILEPEAGLLVVLAGIGRGFVQSGQIVAKGEGLGLMGGQIPAAQEKLNDLLRNSGLPGEETLYMEVRQGREPIDPTSLMRPGDT